MKKSVYFNSPEYKKRKAENLKEMKEKLEELKPITVFGYLAILNSVSGKERIKSRMRIEKIRKR